MRVGLFTDSYLPDINGVVTSVTTLKKALDQLGHTVFVITNHKGSKILYDKEERILRLPGVELKHLYGYTMSSPLNFARDYLEEMNLDIIHTQHEFGVSLYGRMMGKELNIPVLYTYHTMYEEYTHYINPFDIDPIEKAGKWFIRSFSKRLGNTVQAVIAPSLKTKERLESYGVIAPIYIVSTGLDLDAFKAENLDKEKVKSIREEVGVDKDDKVLVFVGRLAKEKSLEMPIEAIALAQDPHLHLVVVGSGTDENYFKEVAKKWGISEQVHFVGRVPSDHIPYYYAAFDGFVSASLSETQGLTYIEALASGLIVFGRRDEVLDGLLEEGKNGFYFDSAQELVEKIKTFYSMSEKERLQAKTYCVEKSVPYSKELFGQKVVSVYNQVINDYKRTFTVSRIRIEDDFVALSLERESDTETLKIRIPLDDFFEFKIGLKTKLDAYLVSSYLDMQEYYQAYSILKRRVFSKDATAFEVKKYAAYHFNLDQAKIDQLIHEFEEKNWIDDRQYAFDKSSYWHDLGYSKKNIANKLKKVGISADLIEEVLSNLNESQELANARALAERLKMSLKKQSSRRARQSLIHKLISKGYSMDIAQEVGESLALEEDDSEALDYTIKKAIRLYSSLPEDKRQSKIILYCLRQGFSKEEVEERLETSEEWYD